MNLLKVEGKIFKDIVQFGNSDKPVARVTVLVKGVHVKDNKTYYLSDFLEFVAFSPISISLIKEFKKDDTVKVEATVRNRSYTNKKNEKIYTNDFVIEKISFLDA